VLKLDNGVLVPHLMEGKQLHRRIVPRAPAHLNVKVSAAKWSFLLDLH